MAQEKKNKATLKKETEELQDLPQAQPTNTDIDEILDAIDEVLEENAQAFVEGYVQKGGE